MRWAVFSDVHGQLKALEAILKDAEHRRAEAYLCLGDIGHAACVRRLIEIDAAVVFGNWETSRWNQLPSSLHDWALQLPPIYEGEHFLAAHAAPTLPPSAHNVVDVMDYLLEHELHWRDLFPYLDEDEDARLLTWSTLVEQGKPLFFHGHTHRQQVWAISPKGAMRLIPSSRFDLVPNTCYLVGVGSVGLPEGGPPGYVLFDDQTQTIELITLR